MALAVCNKVIVLYKLCSAKTNQTKYTVSEPFFFKLVFLLLYFDENMKFIKVRSESSIQEGLTNSMKRSKSSTQEGPNYPMRMSKLSTQGPNYAMKRSKSSIYTRRTISSNTKLVQTGMQYKCTKYF